MRLVTVALLLALTGAADAQPSAALRPGDLVRISPRVLPSGNRVGRLAGIGNDSLTVRFEQRWRDSTRAWRRDTLPVTLGWASVTRLETGHRRSRLRGAGRGFVRGAAISTITFATVLGAAMLAYDPSQPSDDGIGYAPLFAMLAAVPITGVSTLVGAIAPGTRWTELPAPAPHGPECTRALNGPTSAESVLRCVRQGGDVRVRLDDSRRVQGSLAALQPGAARIASGAREDIVALGDIRIVSLPRRHTRTGAITGAVVGGIALGTAFGALSSGLCADSSCGGAFGQGAAVGLPIGGVLGAGIGALIGRQVRTWPEAWRR